MARPKRKKIEFTEDSLNSIFQEIYDDTHNIRATIKRLFNKWEIRVKEGGEIAAIGDQIVKLIAQEAKNQDQKLMLLKYLKEIVFIKDDPSKSGSNSNSDDKEITSDDRNALISIVQQELKNRSKDNN